jgi:hypothetical protein
MVLARIRPGDLVEVDKKGRRFIAHVEDVVYGAVKIVPLGRENYFSATPREIVNHWRKARGGERQTRRCSSAAQAGGDMQLDMGGGFRWGGAR